MVKQMKRTISTPSAPCTPSSEDRKLGISLTIAGHWWTNDHIIMHRNLQEYFLLYCIDGSGFCEMGHSYANVVPGTVVVLHPGIPHSYGCTPDTGWEILWMHIDGDYCKRLIEACGFTYDNFSKNIGIRTDLIDAFSDLIQSTESVHGHYSEDITVALFRLLTRLTRLSSTLSSADRGFLDRIDYRVSDLQECAAKFGYSKGHFSKLFTEAIGISPWQYILHLKVAKAKELLLNTKMLIKDISLEVGFEDPNYFARIFRKITGMSPDELRAVTKNYGK